MEVRRDTYDLIKRRGLLAALYFSFVIIFSNGSAQANSLPEPNGEVILTISGKLTRHNGKGIVRLDRAMLEMIGTHEIVTQTFYSSKASKWRGVLMRNLLAYIGAKGDDIEVVALDRYRAVIPRSDFEKYDVILALEQNDEKLTVRSRGPSRIIYPSDQNEELRAPEYGARLVWQIEKMIIK